MANHRPLPLATGTLLACVALALGGGVTARADVFSGTLYYTNNNGGNDVNKVSYTYNDSTHTLNLGAPQNVAAVNGADGIMFAPNGNLLVSSNTVSAVYSITPNGSSVTSVPTNDALVFHMALDPGGTKFYSSNSYQRSSGNLDVFPLNPVAGATPYVIHGTQDTNVTQLAFAPNGKVFYTNGVPNSNGTIGQIDISNLNNIQTTRLYGATTSSHGILYDPYTGLMTLFGGGAVGTFDPNNPGTTLKQHLSINADFDQGALDGLGHAFIAGNNQITFIDYRATGDITSTSDFITIKGGFGGIDDLAPLFGLGAPPAPVASTVPEPSTLALFGLAGAALAAWGRRRPA